MSLSPASRSPPRQASSSARSSWGASAIGSVHGCIPRIRRTASILTTTVFGAAVVGLALGATLAGCFGTAAYPCEDNTQCVLDGRAGVCEAEGYCSLPDEGCDSGRRFTEHAPSELANGCVGEVGGSSGDESSDAGGSGPSCEGEGCGCVEQLLVRDDRTCVIAQGRLYCWGDNEYGAVGPGEPAVVTVPTAIELSVVTGPVQQVAIGDGHTCARMPEGVVCWGANDQGQVDTVFMGGGKQPAQLGPTPLTGTSFAATRSIAVGSGWSCALHSEGLVLTCWGRSLAFMEPTDGGPWTIELDRLAADLAMTDSSACARSVDGQVECVGLNPQGQLGVSGSMLASSDAVVSVPLGAAVDRLVASPAHYCAAASDRVQCWGGNEAGETGWAVDDELSERMPSSLPLGADAMALGRDTSCALVGSSVSCWGLSPPLGAAVSSPEPTDQNFELLVEGTIGALGLGTSHACALVDGQVWCWGDNSQGQLGVPGAPSTEPVLVMTCPE